MPLYQNSLEKLLFWKVVHSQFDSDPQSSGPILRLWCNYRGDSNTAQYNNTKQLSFDKALRTLKFKSALTRLSGADAVVLQSNCVRRTCSRSLHSLRLEPVPSMLQA